MAKDPTMTPVAICWICQAPADSAEHKIKKADLVRTYGKGPYVGGSAPVHVRGGKVTSVQGPGSTKLKYEPSLCQSCNTAGTQAYDRAYDRFITWLFENELAVLRKRLINFEDVYGRNFEEGQLNLFRYFVKSFGCQLVDAGQPVPPDLVDLLPRKTFRTALKITFAVSEDILLFPEPDRSGFIGHNGLIALISKSDPTKINGYVWAQHQSWFTICYWYSVAPDSGIGSTWIANAQHVYLGSIVSSITGEQRAEFLEKVRIRKLELTRSVTRR